MDVERFTVKALALEYPDADDDEGDDLAVGNGELAASSRAVDGADEYSATLSLARPGLCRSFRVYRSESLTRAR